MAGFQTMRVLAVGVLLALTGGCDMLGIDTPAKQQAAAEADGKAIGSACRHAGRAIEDCFTLNPRASKAAVFAGWKEMNDYMTKNKIEVVQPQIAHNGKDSAATAAPPATVPAAPAEDAAKPEKGKSAEKVAAASSRVADNPDDGIRTKIAPVADSSVNAARARAHHH